MSPDVVDRLIAILIIVAAAGQAGIGHYVGMIGFPCILFVALATLSPAGGTLPLMLAIGIAKVRRAGWMEPT